MPAVDGPGEWEVEFYADESGREPCREWMGKLTPLKRIALEEAIRLRWSADKVRRKVEGVSAVSAGKAEKIMLRVFFCTSGRRIILLLSGYDKARDPGERRQGREIAGVRRLLTAHRESERRRGKAQGTAGAGGQALR